MSSLPEKRNLISNIYKWDDYYRYIEKYENILKYVWRIWASLNQVHLELDDMPSLAYIKYNFLYFSSSFEFYFGNNINMIWNTDLL